MVGSYHGTAGCTRHRFQEKRYETIVIRDLRQIKLRLRCIGSQAIGVRGVFPGQNHDYLSLSDPTDSRGRHRFYQTQTTESFHPDIIETAKMHASVLLALLPLPALAAVNGRCTGGQATGAWGDNGICISTSNCRNAGGEYKSGACPNDPDNIKCCLVGIGPSSSTNPCGGVSLCKWTSNGCTGSWRSGECFSFPFPSTFTLF